ncbi:unnamed protein product [Haemonchus placei]|uniref:GRIP domain-containing protein n=1 Tax=Haemonchus placei TaxID=6290 RepID=A0A0N4WIF9_HAEPC|nr:unnamed protein product [Haemonchus placei]
MRRLGEADPDSGHPTPREDEGFTDDGSESPIGSFFSPLTSTPIVQNKHSSVHTFFENSEKDALDGEEKEALVASVKQLIQTTKKNCKLTRENEKVLNQSQLWNAEKSKLEKQVEDCNALVETLQNELKVKCAKIEQLEARIADLSKSTTENHSEEAFEASEEMVLEKQDVSTQCDQQFDDEETKVEQALREIEDRNRTLDAENKELRCKLENFQTVLDEVVMLREQLNTCNQKVGFLESENLDLQRKEKDSVKKLAAKAEELVDFKGKYERLCDEIKNLRDERASSADLRLKNEELERLLAKSEQNLKALQTQESELRFRILSCEREIEELKENDNKMKSSMSEKMSEMNRLREESAKRQEMVDKLTEENVLSSALIEELKVHLSRSKSELAELRFSLASEKQAREAAENNARHASELEIKLRERLSQMDNLVASNEKLSQELEFLRQVASHSSTKEETEQLSTALRECREHLKQAIAEKNELKEREVANSERIAEVESLRYELKCRDETVARLRTVESKLRDDLEEKCAEIADLGHRLGKINEECDRVREEFHIFQQLAEQQYCDMIEEKRGQIEALSSRLAQLESYPGIDVGKVEKTPRALYDCILPAVRELAEKAASESASIADAIKEMRETFVGASLASPKDCRNVQQCNPHLSPEKRYVETQTSIDLSEEDEDALPLSRLITSVENCRNCAPCSSSSLVQTELQRLLVRVKHEQETSVIDAAVMHFLEECHKYFTDAIEHATQELRVIHDDREVLEKKLRLVAIVFSLLDRKKNFSPVFQFREAEMEYRTSDLSAAKMQIDQYRIKLRKQTEELEAVSCERDNAEHLMVEFQKLEQDSQEEIRKANDAIDELEKELQDARADLEKEKREMISLKDENDMFSIAIQHLKGQVTHLEQKVLDLERRCEKLTRTERYNQKTIQIVCESFWEREEFVERLRRRSYERKKLIEHFVHKVGEIISSFKGDEGPVDSMQTTIKAWTETDVQEDVYHENKKRALRSQIEELGSGDQLDMAYTQTLRRFRHSCS